MGDYAMIDSNTPLDLIARLKDTRNVLIKFSDIAVKQKKIKEAKKFDIYAISVNEAIDILKELNNE